MSKANTERNTGNLKPPWKPGQSGNLKGRPTKEEQQLKRFRQYFGQWFDVPDIEAMKAIFGRVYELATDPKHRKKKVVCDCGKAFWVDIEDYRAFLDIWKTIMEYTAEKPKTKIEVSKPEPKDIVLVDTESIEFIEQQSAEIKRLKARIKELEDERNR